MGLLANIRKNLMQADTVENTKAANDETYDITKEKRSNASGKLKRAMRLMGFNHWVNGDYTLANCELIFSAASRLSNALAAMPMREYAGSEIIKSDLTDLVSFEPNPNMTAFRFFNTLEACRDTYGNAYALKVFKPTQIQPDLYPLDPMRVRPIVEKQSRELWYKSPLPKARRTMYTITT